MRKPTDYIIKSHKLILPIHLNDNQSLFGGQIMQWIDEIAYITACKYTSQKMVTVSIEKVKFIHAIKCGDIIEIISNVIDCSLMKLKIEVNIYILNKKIKQKAVSSLLYFAAIDKNNKAILISKKNVYQDILT